MRVSVCIPTFNRIEYLTEAFASVMAQDFREFEVIVGDNSGDRSYHRMVDDLVGRHSGSGVEIRVFHHAHNRGMEGNANFLIGEARGEYCIYFTDDDRMRAHCLRMLVEALDRQPAASFAFGDHWIIRTDGSVDEAASIATSRRYGRSSLRGAVIRRPEISTLALRQAFPLQCMLFRTRVLRQFGFDPAFARILDWDLQLRIAASESAACAVYCADRLVEYRSHPAQFTAVGEPLADAQLCIRSLERCRALETDTPGLYRRRLAEKYVSLALAEALGGRRRAALAAAWQAVRLHPGGGRAYGAGLVGLFPAALRGPAVRLGRRILRRP